MYDTEGTRYFLKKVKTEAGGSVLMERHLSTLVTSSSMSRQYSPRSLGVFVEQGGNMIDIPDFNDDTRLFEVQEFAGEGESYLRVLERNRLKKHSDDEDVSLLNRIWMRCIAYNSAHRNVCSREMYCSV